MSCLTDRKIYCRHYHEGYETWAFRPAVENGKTSGRELPFSKLHFQWVFHFIKKNALPQFFLKAICLEKCCTKAQRPMLTLFRKKCDKVSSKDYEVLIWIKYSFLINSRRLIRPKIGGQRWVSSANIKCV